VGQIYLQLLKGYCCGWIVNGLQECRCRFWESASQKLEVACLSHQEWMLLNLRPHADRGDALNKKVQHKSQPMVHGINRHRSHDQHSKAALPEIERRIVFIAPLPAMPVGVVGLLGGC
jgi:hypothetical protein